MSETNDDFGGDGVIPNVAIKIHKDPEPPSWFDWSDDDHVRGGFIERFAGNHTGWFALTVVVVIAALFGGVILLASHSGPALVYSPQVVHRVIQTDDGRHVDCVFTHAGTTCDWEHAR